MLYTTNAIETYHRTVRKVTKTKGAFCSEDVIIKQIYLATLMLTEVAKVDVALVLRNYAIHVLVNGMLNETISFKQLKDCTIEEKTGMVRV